jgi:hypothetical protein
MEAKIEANNENVGVLGGKLWVSKEEVKGKIRVVKRK